MVNKRVVVLMGCILVFAANVNAQVSKKQLQDMYVMYLRDEGYRPSVDSDGDVVFKAEGLNFYIDVDDEDLESFRVVLPKFWELESPEERIRAYEVANYINRTTKVAKVFIISSEDDVSMDANIYIGKPDDFKLHFRRMINLLIAELREFRDKMIEPLQEADAVWTPAAVRAGRIPG
ncbi:MAG: YbjN domain-containing protein [Treponema sp.]|jgi:hypothetical protein|nr:YbjN domain-containing protein [Treponema sp.]